MRTNILSEIALPGTFADTGWKVDKKTSFSTEYIRKINFGKSLSNAEYTAVIKYLKDNKFPGNMGIIGYETRDLMYTFLTTKLKGV